MLWYTKSNRHYNAADSEKTSKDVRIITTGKYEGKAVDMMMFVRKNKDDRETSKEFYYLGRVSYRPNVNAAGVDTNVEEVKMPGTDISVVRLGLRFETPVDRSLYDYLTSSDGMGHGDKASDGV